MRTAGLLIILALMLAGCGDTSLKYATVSDMGTTALDATHTIHGYTITGDKFTDRIYFLESEGKLEKGAVEVHRPNSPLGSPGNNVILHEMKKPPFAAYGTTQNQL